MKNASVLLFSIMLLAACEQKKHSIGKTMVTKMITTSGIAQNGKGGALLVTDDTTIYYLEGMDTWETSLIGKRIEVTGTLKVETLNEDELKNEQGEYTQGVAGDKRILVNTKWKQLED
jgi:archaellum biogenesis ATPase FlaH